MPPEPSAADAEVTSNFGADAFREAVGRAIRYVREGDIIRWCCPRGFAAIFREPADLVRALRSINPSPYMFYLDFGDFQVVGLPRDTRATGARSGDRPADRRHASSGATREKDIELERELLADPKERAENVMLVDLGRNDVGRVATTGSVRLTEKMTVERYSHVMHIVSNVEGKLREGLDSLDVLRAAFRPAPSAAHPRCARWKSSTSWNPTNADSTPARPDTWASTATWIWR